MQSKNHMLFSMTLRVGLLAIESTKPLSLTRVLRDNLLGFIISYHTLPFIDVGGNNVKNAFSEKSVSFSSPYRIPLQCNSLSTAVTYMCVCQYTPMHTHIHPLVMVILKSLFVKC